MGSPQTSFSINNKAGVPGMLYDKDVSSLIDSKPCGAVALAPGMMVELVAGVLQIAPDGVRVGVARTLGHLQDAGDALEPNPTTGAGEYLPGMEVPVLRKGRIWVVCDTAVSSIVPGVAANFTHSSTGAHGQGTFTTAANSATVGSEVSVTKAVWWADGGLIGANPSIAAIDLSLP